jgi:hypothetical protein
MSDWDALTQELDRWPAGEATFWWRDDDATARSPALARLIALGPQPLAIAAIPARAETALAGLVDETRIDVLQHGYDHVNHEPAGEKKAELGSARPADAVIEALRRGRRRMDELFGPRFLPVIVPPWNRIADGVVACLTQAGFRGLSAYRARPRLSSPGLRRVNTHVDILDWRQGGRFLGRSAVIALVVAHLAARRRGEADPAEPTGLLTHHARMDDDAFAFTRALLKQLASYPAVQWRAARDIFAGGSPLKPE